MLTVAFIMDNLEKTFGEEAVNNQLILSADSFSHVLLCEWSCKL